jgi:hypothetical protein
MPVALCRGGFAPTRGMSSRREVTPEALESSGDRNAGIAMCRTPIGSREVSWLGTNVMGSDQPIWALRISTRNRYSDRRWGWGEQLAEPVGLNDRSEVPSEADHCRLVQWLLKSR